MYGNVEEWCLDWSEDDISEHGGKVNIDPSNPALTRSKETGKNRVTRGGNWGDNMPYCRPAFRQLGRSPDTRARFLGFRLVCTDGLQ